MIDRTEWNKEAKETAELILFDIKNRNPKKSVMKDFFVNTSNQIDHLMKMPDNTKDLYINKYILIYMLQGLTVMLQEEKNVEPCNRIR